MRQSDFSDCLGYRLAVREQRRSAVRPFFRPQHFLKKITRLESALNSEQNYVPFFKRTKKNFSEKIFALVPLGNKEKKFLFFFEFDLDVGYQPC